MSQYQLLLQSLESELEELCVTFHSTTERDVHLYELCMAKQKRVSIILSRILNGKTQSVPILRVPQNIPRPTDLRLDVRDRTVEGLLVAARLANRPFKRALRALAAHVRISPGRVHFGAIKTLDFAEEKAEENLQLENLFDLNRATLVFEDETEFQAILTAIPSFFEAIVYLKNEFEEPWERAKQTPCLYLNLRLKNDSLPAEFLELLEPEGSWIVELRVTMQDFLDVEQRCRAISEIEWFGNPAKGLPLPRGCPVCGLLQRFVSRSQLTQLEDMELGGQKLVKKGIWEGRVVAYNLVAVGESCREREKTFSREVGLLTRLEHPNIVQILGVVKEPRELGFVTEWVPHGSMRSCLQDPGLSQQLDEWDVVLQLCEALIYLHGHGVVHYDLKSQNVLCRSTALANENPEPDRKPGFFSRGPRSPRRTVAGASPNDLASNQGWVVKIGDFGLSMEVMASLHTKVNIGGTPNWQAPETWNEVECFHPSADVYAFGCMLIELFGRKSKPGCYPWMEFTNRQDIKRQVCDLKKKPPELLFVEDANVQAVIAECLTLEPEKRPSMKKVRTRLLAAQVHSPVF